MMNARTRERTLVEIPVTVTTVLESLTASIVDLSENGAQIVGAALKPGTRFTIDHEDQSVFATVMWSEVDRMGVRFAFPLADGPLNIALEAARGPRHLPSAMASRTGFGRRGFA